MKDKWIIEEKIAYVCLYMVVYSKSDFWAYFLRLSTGYPPDGVQIADSAGYPEQTSAPVVR